ncbi:MAG: MmgE/PrpD family protein [Deltaproteobacteria bacterium]|nr:MmgE/PrpD family protein [Deltaproteobacteria bacterium]
MVKKSAAISPIMRKLSDHIASAPGRQLPPEVAERAKHHLLDTISAMVSGSRLLPGRRGIDYVRALGGVREACVLGTRLVAMMLIDGEITFASAHDNRRVGDPMVLALKKRIELAGSPELSRTKTTQAVVEIVTREGVRLRYHTRAVRGRATNPMQRDEVARKGRDLLVPVLGTRRTEALIDRIWNIERIDDVPDLRRLLRPSGDATARETSK